MRPVRRRSFIRVDPMRWLLILTLPFYLLDQLTKWLVVREFHLHEVRPVIPGFFDLVHVTNTGAAFGVFSGMNVVFIFLSLAAAAVALYFMRKLGPHERLLQIACALLLAGILGNLTDRLVHGHVIDFLSFNLHVPLADPWPSFNVADACICIAAGLILIGSMRKAPPEQEEQPLP